MKIQVGTLCIIQKLESCPEVNGKLVTVTAALPDGEYRFTPRLYTKRGEWTERGAPPFLVPIAPPGNPDKVDERNKKPERMFS